MDHKVGASCVLSLQQRANSILACINKLQIKGNNLSIGFGTGGALPGAGPETGHSTLQESCRQIKSPAESNTKDEE